MPIERAAMDRQQPRNPRRRAPRLQEYNAQQSPYLTRKVFGSSLLELKGKLSKHLTKNRVSCGKRTLKPSDRKDERRPVLIEPKRSAEQKMIWFRVLWRPSRNKYLGECQFGAAKLAY